MVCSTCTEAPANCEEGNEWQKKGGCLQDCTEAELKALSKGTQFETCDFSLPPDPPDDDSMAILPAAAALLFLLD
jgi:hypothetical protein